MLTRKQQYFAGARAGIPILFGFIPVSIAYAIMARQAGLSAGETVLMSAAVFAGASQMMAAEMVGKGAAAVTVIIAAFIMNLRHLIMSTCVFNRICHEPPAIRLLAAFGVTDESFGIFTTMEADRCSAPFFLGLITVTYSSWVLGSALGTVLSTAIPPILEASLGIALYALFIGLLLPNLRGNLRLGILAAGAAVMSAVLHRVMDSGWALIVTTLVSAWLGMYFVDLDGEEQA